MKYRVLEIVKRSLAGAEDNLYRASMRFKEMSSEELNQEYGQSGRTCLDILKSSHDECDQLRKCVDWVEKAR